MITLSMPAEVNDLLWIIQEVLRRAVDGTIVPLFVDYANQRVLIGESSVSAGTAPKFEVSGDARIVGSSNGLILPDSGGSGRTYRMQIVEVAGEDGSNQPVIQLTRVD